MLRSDRIKKELEESLKRLKKFFSATLKSGKAGIYEWLKDNYYLLEREGNDALKSLKHLNYTDLGIYGACLSAAKSGERFEAALKTELAKKQYTVTELEMLCALMKTAFIHLALSGLDAGDTEQIKTAITGLRAIPSCDFHDLVEEFCAVDKILRNDPSGIYEKLDDTTRALYRNACVRIARDTGSRENLVAKEAVDRAKSAAERQKQHVGYFLLRENGKQKKRRARGRFFMVLRLLLPLLVSIVCSVSLGYPWLAFLFYFPFFEIFRVFIDFFAGHKIAPEYLPRLEIGDTIPAGAETLVTVSALLPSPQNAKQVAQNLYKLYMTNSQGEIGFCLLADLKESKFPYEPSDKIAIEAMEREIKNLNRKYGNHFFLIVRNRSRIETQKAYAGYERKRGAITELISFIKGTRLGFASLCGDRAFLKKVKYIIALDSDTNLLMNTAAQMVAAALHPLNKPVCKNGRVVSGFGILAPKVSADLTDSQKTAFSRVMSGRGGVTAYTSLCGDLYFDLFGRSIFTGKGLIDVDAYYQCIPNALPDERILSHDILESGLLRTAYISDIEVTDSCPSGAAAYLSRLHRWVRGDFQNILWLFSKTPAKTGKIKNPFDRLSRYMLFDNIRRPVTSVVALTLLIFALFMPDVASYLSLIAALGILAAPLFSTVYSVISGGIIMLSGKYYSRAMPAALGSMAEGLVSFVLLIKTALVSLSAAATALFRQFISHKNLLEWTTAADRESQKDSLLAEVKQSLLPVILSLILIVFSSGFTRLVGIATLFCPVVISLMKRPTKKKEQALSAAYKEKIRAYAACLWRYYDELCTAKHHFLPPDNIEESPVSVTAHRTSPTNISLMLLCVLAARDFSFITTEDMVSKIKNTLNTIDRLETYHGNLLNWYDTKSLKPLHPRFVSTVDSGNFVCFLVALKEGLSEYVSENGEIPALIACIEKIINSTDLSVFYNPKRKLFHIGFDLEKNQLSDCYYDLLMSESRMTSYFAIAKRQVPKKHYGALGRTLAKEGSYVGPVSWTGTMFEYFMPHLLLPAPESSLEYEALRFCIYCQKRRGRDKNAPFGISESCFYAFDPQLNYQYKAHGVAKLGLKRRLNDEYVLSPYSTFLTLPMIPETAMHNLCALEKMQMQGRYGFYEAADYTKSRIGSKDHAIIRCYMAHHVGMSLIAAENLLYGRINQKRFMRDPQMASALELLEERIPGGVRIFEDETEPKIPEKVGRGNGQTEEFDLISPLSPRAMLLSNGEWQVNLSDCGTGYSSAKGLCLTRKSEDILRRPQGIFAIVKDGETAFSITKAPDYSDIPRRVEFSASSAAFYAETGNLEAGMQVSVHPNMLCEIRRFKFKNHDSKKKKIDLTVYFEPSLAKDRDDSAHPAFSKLFLMPGYDSATNLVHVTRRLRDDTGEPIHLSAGFDQKQPFDYAFSRESLLTRPDGMASLVGINDKEFAKNSLPDPCVAMKISFTLAPKEKRSFHFYLSAASTKDEAAAQLIYCRDNEFEAAVSPLYSGDLESRLCSTILPRLLYPCKDQKERTAGARANQLDVTGLWGMGISGDYKIVLLNIRTKAEAIRIESYIRLHKLLRDQGLAFDLAILSDDSGEYDRPVYDAITEAARLSGSETLLFANGGIHPVNTAQVSADQITLLHAAAAYIVPPSASHIEPPPREYKPKKLLPVSAEEPNAVPDLTVPGGFFENGSFTITEKPPLAWCHEIANEYFGTLLSDKALGFTWYKNARENKLTPWYNDTASDNTGEMVLVRLGGRLYNLTNGSAVSYSDGGAVYLGKIGTLSFSLEISIEKCEKIIKLSFSSQEPVSLSAAYYTEPVLSVDRGRSGQISAKWENGGLTLKNPFNDIGTMRLSADGGADSFSCCRPAFLSGAWDDNTLLPKSDGCAAVITKREFEGDCALVFRLSFAPKEPPQWHETAPSGKITVETPDKGLNHLFNTWLPIQIETARINGRTGFYQCGGAFGFRDQLQDVTALLLWNKDAARRHILRAAAHQFSEGDVLHWWHELPDGHTGVRTKCSDDKLWLPFAVAEYVSKTGDRKILNEQIAYLTGDPLPPDEAERYFKPEVSEETGSLYEHCIRAIENVEFGEHGLPLIGNGDWNDGFSNVGILGRGESVWLAEFMAMVCEQFAGICLDLTNFDTARTLLERATALKQAVDEKAYNGRWYLRAFFDDGSPLGQIGNVECEIDLLPQAFAVLSAMPDKERVSSALSEALGRLVDKEKGIIQLFDPPFDGVLKPGYISGYRPGIRENGGQYTHAAIWLALAVLTAGRIDEGYELIRFLSPIFHANDPGYKTEPMYMAADIYTAEEAYGRGGWTLYTGAAGWYYKTILYALLGILPKNGRIEFYPRLPASWDGFTVHLEYLGTTAEITVKRGAQHAITVDEKPADHLPLDGGRHIVNITAI